MKHDDRNARWLVGRAVVVLVLVGVGWLFLLSRGRQAQPAGDSRPGAAQRKRFNPGTAKDWKGLLPVEVAKKFTEAKTVPERLKWVRTPQQVRPALEEFFTVGPGATEQVAQLKPMPLARTADHSFLRFQARMNDGTNRLLCVVITGDEGAKVDFESYARHGSESWTDLLSGKATEAEAVRVFVKPGIYYNYAFADEQKWSSFVVTSPDVEKPLYFYAARESETAKHLAQLTARRPMRAILAIRSVKGSFKNRQFEVKQLVGRGWIVGKEPSIVP
ncbi:MAG: hypothetical protein AAEJ52_09520 [Myxococcota bacterium]